MDIGLPDRKSTQEHPQCDSQSLTTESCQSYWYRYKMAESGPNNQHLGEMKKLESQTLTRV
jgi:hypothetical protein